MKVAMYKNSLRTLSALLALTILGVALPACAPASTSVPTPSEDFLQAEEQAIYTVLLAESFGEPQMYVLMSETAPGIEGVEGLEATLANILPQLPEMDGETADSFRVRNEAAYPVRPDMDLGLSYVLLTREEMNRIFDINTSGWDVFYTRYPNSPGLTTISRVGFNAGFTQALVYIGTQSHWLAGAGYYVLLEKVDDAWTVVQQIMVWIS
jgi:hypothetical protein